jgi:hypothetical protein
MYYLKTGRAAPRLGVIPYLLHTCTVQYHDRAKLLLESSETVPSVCSASVSTVQSPGLMPRETGCIPGVQPTLRRTTAHCLIFERDLYKPG